MFTTLDFCKNLIMHHAEKNKNVISRLARSVLKNILSRSQKRLSAFGLGPFLRPRQNIFPVRTSHPVNNIYIYRVRFLKGFLSHIILRTNKRNTMTPINHTTATIITVRLIVIMFGYFKDLTMLTRRLKGKCIQW